MGQAGAAMPLLMSVAMWHGSRCCSTACQSSSKTDPHVLMWSRALGWRGLLARLMTQRRRGGGDGDRGLAA